MLFHPLASAPLAGLDGTAITLSVDAGGFNQTGQTVGLNKAIKLSVDVGSFSVSGQTVGLFKALTRTADGDSFTLRARCKFNQSP